MLDVVSAVTIRRLSPEARFSLRVAAGDRAAASAAFGLPLPERIGDTAHEGGRSLLCLGPDEWVLTAPEAEAEAIEAASAALEVPHSLVAIADRDVSFLIDGASEAVLAAGCPRDLGGIGVGRGCRTVFDGVSVVLWRESETRWRLDVWRSYAPHVEHLLRKVSRELAIGV